MRFEKQPLYSEPTLPVLQAQGLITDPATYTPLQMTAGEQMNLLQRVGGPIWDYTTLTN